MRLNDGADKMEFYVSPEELRVQTGRMYFLLYNKCLWDCGRTFFPPSIVMMGLYWHIRTGVTNCSKQLRVTRHATWQPYKPQCLCLRSFSCCWEPGLFVWVDQRGTVCRLLISNWVVAKELYLVSLLSRRDGCFSWKSGTHWTLKNKFSDCTSG